MTDHQTKPDKQRRAEPEPPFRRRNFFDVLRHVSRPAQPKFPAGNQPGHAGAGEVSGQKDSPPE